MVDYTDDEIVELTAEEAGSPIPLEAGVYRATIVKVKPVPSKRPDWKDQVQIDLETVDELDDEGNPYVLWAFASKILNTASKLYEWCTNVTGQQPELGKEFRINDLLVGKPCRAQIEEKTKDGITRKRVSALLSPSKRQVNGTRPAQQTKPQHDEEARCADCFEPIGADGFITGGGVAFCGEHDPRKAA